MSGGEGHAGGVGAFALRLKRAVATVAFNLKLCGQMVAMRAERIWVQKFRLANAYLELGSEIYRQRRFEGDFPELFKETDSLLGESEKHRGGATADAATKGFIATVQRFARNTADTAWRAVLTLRTNAELSALGRAAFAKHGNASGAEHEIAAIEAHSSRVATLTTGEATLKASVRCDDKPAIMVACAAAGCVVLVISFSLRSAEQRGSGGAIVKVLTAEYYPFRQGTTRFVTMEGQDKDSKAIYVRRWSYREAGAISVSLIAAYGVDRGVLVNNPAGLSLPVRFDDEYYRVHEGFVEEGSRISGIDGVNKVAWTPEIKIGAGVGESWQDKIGGTYSVSAIDEDLAVITKVVGESTIPGSTGTVPAFRHVVTYRRGYGPLHAETFVKNESGKFDPVNRFVYSDTADSAGPGAFDSKT